MRNRLIICCVFFLLVFSAYTQERMDKMWGEQQTKKLEKERGYLFEWGNYAMFIHWGLFSHLGNIWNGKTYYGIGEWMIDVNMANANRDEYKAVSRSFNPTDFDARKIAQLAKDAGMKYVIITSKHHDGFAMYHSQYDKFNIVDATPFGRDPMKELADACKELGLGFGFYYSHNQDWTTPGAFGAARVDTEGNPKTFTDYFSTKCLPQVEEITRNYGDIELIWFDTPGSIPKEYVQKLVEVVHRNQPNALVSGRVGYNLGDYQTLGDMEVPLENIDGLWESVDVTNDVWGYAWYDQNWKSPKQILKYLISTVARGGTYMLNIGPDGKGNVPDFLSRTLRASGKWISRYPQVIYGAEPSPWKHALPWGDVVKQKEKLFLVIYEWPSSGKLYLPGLQTRIKSANLLSDDKKQRVKYIKEGDWIVFQVPSQQPESLVNVIELEMKDNQLIIDNTLTIDPEIGLKDLSVKFAIADNSHIYKSSWMEKFGEWKYAYCVNDLHKGGKLTWTINVHTPGIYQVTVKTRGDGRFVWRIETDEKEFVQNQQSASSLFMDRPLGWLRFDKPGKHTVTITMPEGEKADLTAVSFIPIDFE